MKHILLLPFHEARAFVVWFIFSLPGKTGSALRYLFARSTMDECGTGARFGQNVTIDCARNIKIKKNVTFDYGCELNACGGNLIIDQIVNSTGTYRLMHQWQAIFLSVKNVLLVQA